MNILALQTLNIAINKYFVVYINFESLSTSMSSESLKPNAGRALEGRKQEIAIYPD
jgi:hypothetical protein